MVRRRRFTDKTVAELEPQAERYIKPDPELAEHYIRVRPNGAKSYVVVARGPDRKQRWKTIGAVSLYSLDEAREKARKAIKAIKSGEDPAPPESFAAVIDEWFGRAVQSQDPKKRLRSEAEIKRFVDRMKKPWSGRNFISIRRIDVAKLLDDIEDKHGARQADYALAVIRQAANWYANRHETYQSPIVKGMRRWKPKDNQRKRILNDDEIRAVWKQAKGSGKFGAIVRLLLLTAQRLDKVAALCWEDVPDDGVWRIATKAREKGNAGILELPDAALAIIREQHRLESNPHVFHAQRGDGYFSGFSKAKVAFDEKVKVNGEALPSWRLHDLRRTARSLMSRAGVRPDIAERVMGHALPVIEGTYDLHEYRKEKAEALRRLSDLIDVILNPPTGNVVHIASAR